MLGPSKSLTSCGHTDYTHQVLVSYLVLKKEKQASPFLLLFFFFNLLLAVLGLCCCEDLCLVVERRCYCPVLVYGLVTEVASFVVDPGLQSTSLTFVVHGLSCSTDCGTFLDQGSNTCLPHWQADS